ncbi:MAG: hypothetical protein KGY66_07405 [Candidatus Thermoplasmatota archaeon]|nr:hypothetical protein [Candidatus Thermoplasmatota archaeon]
MCIFIDNWDCNFAGTEITLDICKTCIKARKLYHETKHDEALQKQQQMIEKRKKEPKPQKPQQTMETKERESKRRKKDIVPEKKRERPQKEPAKKQPAIEDSVIQESLVDQIETETGSSKNEIEDESSIETLEPISITEMKNLEGSINDIRDDPTKPTDTWLRSTGEGETCLLKADFPNPPDQLQAGEDQQEFLVRVRRTEDEFFFPLLPEINIKICEEDTVVTESGRIEVEDTHGEVVSLTWNAGRLFDMYGPDVEIIIEGFTSGDEDMQNRIEIGAVEWRANLVQSMSEKDQSKGQTLEEKLAAPLIEESEDETIDTIRSDLNPLE